MVGTRLLTALLLCGASIWCPAPVSPGDGGDLSTSTTEPSPVALVFGGSIQQAGAADVGYPTRWRKGPFASDCERTELGDFELYNLCNPGEALANVVVLENGA